MFKMQNTKVTVVDLEHTAWKAATIAELSRPFVESDRTGDALKHASVYAESCLGWIWRQWLLRTQPETIREQVEAFVERGMQMRASCRSSYNVPDTIFSSCIAPSSLALRSS